MKADELITCCTSPYIEMHDPSIVMSSMYRYVISEHRNGRDMPSRVNGIRHALGRYNTGFTTMILFSQSRVGERHAAGECAVRRIRALLVSSDVGNQPMAERGRYRHLDRPEQHMLVVATRITGSALPKSKVTPTPGLITA